MNRSRTTLKDVISGHFVCASPQDSLRKALAAMLDNRVSALPVIDEDKRCVGVISVTDILGFTKELSEEVNSVSRAIQLNRVSLTEKFDHLDLLNERVEDWMSPDPITVGIDSSVRLAAKRILENQVHRLIVVDERQRVAGIVSTMDLLAILTEEESD